MILSRLLGHNFAGGRCSLFKLTPVGPRHVAALASITQSVGPKKKVVFLGTPEVAAGVLSGLLDASRRKDSQIEVIGVVSQPGKPKGRGNRKIAVPSPVSALAVENGFEDGHQLVCPTSARDEDFLSLVSSWEPDLCVTAAYGNFLPNRFLDIPKHGTLNIHPSLLPKYRGASPVNRALLNGEREVGVTILYTILEMDAGPILAQRRVAVDNVIQVDAHRNSDDETISNCASLMLDSVAGSRTPLQFIRAWD